MRMYVNAYDGALGCPECEWVRGNPMGLVNVYVMFGVRWGDGVWEIALY